MYWTCTISDQVHHTLTYALVSMGTPTYATIKPGFNGSAETGINHTHKSINYSYRQWTKIFPQFKFYLYISYKTTIFQITTLYPEGIVAEDHEKLNEIHVLVR